MEYYAHIREDGEKQMVLEHLTNVSDMAGAFSKELLREICRAAGRYHDIGKYAPAFQQRLMTGKPKFEHSACGAIALDQMSKNKMEECVAWMLEYCIAGHHTGLPDGGTKSGRGYPYDGTALYHRLGRAPDYTGERDFSAYQKDVPLAIPDAAAMMQELLRAKDQTEMLERYAFFTRYVFSCLTDADFLDTEQFCNPQKQRGLSADFAEVLKALNQKLSGFRAETPLQKARQRLQQQAFQNAAQSDAPISILNMPTGSGKTLCSLKIALQKVLNNTGKKRIIYVIPYTSIIEQTAEQFEQEFGQYADILQHHSNYVYDTDPEEQADDTVSAAQRRKSATENWDAPFLVTTSVQFFQSLYHYKGTGLRKLHNMADAVIVFDEVHLLPVELLQPCLRGIGYLIRYLNSEAIFLSATMPDYTELFQRYLPGIPVCPLITDRTDFAAFQKCRFHFLGMTDYDNVLEKASAYPSSLIIVNQRKSAREVFAQVSGKKYHLSTDMIPADRSRVIGEIRADLKKGVPITVVSTSLVEAGVDLDFSAVFRQMAGLDNILQSAGRCNREGKLQKGDVYIFETEERVPRTLEQRVQFTKAARQKCPEIAAPECIGTYYRQFYTFCDKDEIRSNTIARDAAGIDNLPFRTYAENFRFIQEDTVGVVIPTDDTAKALLAKLESGKFSVRRKLQRYTVSLRRHAFSKAAEAGILCERNGVFVLADMAYYEKETGLNLEHNGDLLWDGMFP